MWHWNDLNNLERGPPKYSYLLTDMLDVAWEGFEQM